MNDENMGEDIDKEWELRVLCSDESCIGTIGPDGRCKECGRPYEGSLPKHQDGPAATAQGDSSPAPDISQTPLARESLDGDEQADSPDDEWEQRTLCEDESCIGTIGPDGCCTECGRTHGGQINKDGL